MRHLLVAFLALFLTGCGFLDSNDTGKGGGQGRNVEPDPILQLVDKEGQLSVMKVPATDGEKGLSDFIERFFPFGDFDVRSVSKETTGSGSSAPETSLVIYRQTKRASVRQMVEYLSSLYEDGQSPFLTEHQVVEFLAANEDALSEWGGRTPFFIIKGNDGWGFVGNYTGSRQMILYSLFDDFTDPMANLDPEKFDPEWEVPNYHFIVPVVD
ncbi:MAG: hypothetical protein WDZ70_00110 [Candidatus Paceibacterota bacterium]